MQDNMATDGAPTAQKPAGKGKMYDMTSADYYFDSYAHFGTLPRSQALRARCAATCSPRSRRRAGVSLTGPGTCRHSRGDAAVDALISTLLAPGCVC